MSKSNQRPAPSINEQPMESAFNMKVDKDLTVQIISNPNFDFLMDSSEVAKGYGVSVETIRSHKNNHSDELIENVHFISSVENINGGNLTKKSIYWTKKGIIRLGFFIKSERSIVFRNWAESIILKVTSNEVDLPKVVKRKHNRLTADRLLSIMSDVALIEDKELRVRLRDKIMGKEVCYE